MQNLVEIGSVVFEAIMNKQTEMQTYNDRQIYIYILDGPSDVARDIVKYNYFCLFGAFFYLGCPSEPQGIITESFSHSCYM